MNQNAPQPSFELPSMPNEAGAEIGKNQETGPARPEQQTQPPLPTMPMTPPSAVPAAYPIDPSAGQQPQASPMIADDNDLIEKEWVLKAKQIVASTKDDPYTQNKEMSKFKADYLKKRYNKDIKVEE